MSDFALHSIGVILFRSEKEDIFHLFIEEMLGNIEMMSLPKAKYSELKQLKPDWGLDFDAIKGEGEEVGDSG